MLLLNWNNLLYWSYRQNNSRILSTPTFSPCSISPRQLFLISNAVQLSSTVLRLITTLDIRNFSSKSCSDWIDFSYTSTKGAIVAFTRSIAGALASKGIRANLVAPGPIVTPLIFATMGHESLDSFGQGVPLGRAGQPSEIATCFVFLASSDSSYISGNVLHPNGGVVIN